jgi:Lactonase, 7-bladed beta-propeller
MTSFLHHKKVSQLLPPRNRAEEAPLAGCKEAGRLLLRLLITRTKPSRLGLAQGGGIVRRGWLSVFSTLAIGFVWLVAPLHAQFAYVANLVSNDVSAYSIASNGVLAPVPGSPFATGNFPWSVAVDPTGKFAYVANNGSNNVSAYSIASNGVLTQLTSLGSPFPAGIAPHSVAVDPTGKFAYVANEGSNNVSAYSIASNGVLTQLTSLGSPFPAGNQPTSVAITPLVPFASSFAKLEIAKQGFDLKESFTLGANSNGINPVTENVTLQIGTFSVTIPPGSFKQIALRISGFQGVIKNVNLNVQIVALGNNIFALAAESKGVNLTGLTNPVTVVLTIGNETGSTAIPRKNEREKRDDGQGKQEREDQETGDEEE